MVKPYHPRKLKIPLFLSPNLWMTMVLILFLGSFAAGPYRDLVLYAAIGAAMISLWAIRHLYHIRRRIYRFRDEVVHGKDLEGVGNLAMARAHFLKLQDKYADIAHFKAVVKEYLDQIESRLTGDQDRIVHEPVPPEEGSRDPLTKAAVTIQGRAEKSPIQPSGPSPIPVRWSRERRRYPRIPLDLPVGTIASLTTATQSRAVIKDISAGGMLIECLTAFEPGDNVMIPRVPLRKDLTLEDVFVRILHVRRQEGRVSMGVEFSYLDDEDRRMISRFVTEEAAAAKATGQK